MSESDLLEVSIKRDAFIIHARPADSGMKAWMRCCQNQATFELDFSISTETFLELGEAMHVFARAEFEMEHSRHVQLTPRLGLSMRLVYEGDTRVTVSYQDSQPASRSDPCEEPGLRLNWVWHTDKHNLSSAGERIKKYAAAHGL